MDETLDIEDTYWFFDNNISNNTHNCKAHFCEHDFPQNFNRLLTELAQATLEVPTEWSQVTTEGQ